MLRSLRAGAGLGGVAGPRHSLGPHTVTGPPGVSVLWVW